MDLAVTLVFAAIAVALSVTAIGAAARRALKAAERRRAASPRAVAWRRYVRTQDPADLERYAEESVREEEEKEER